MSSPPTPPRIPLARRRILAAALGIGVTAGGARLAHDEVRLASSRAELTGLRQKAERADAAAERVARLELDLREALAGREALVEQAQAAEAALTSRTTALAQARQRAEQAEAALAEQRESVDELQAARQALHADVEAAREALGELRGAVVDLREREAAARAALAAAAARAAATEEALEQERARASELAERAERARREVNALAGQVDRLQGDLAEAVRRARGAEGTIARLQEAGVNVPRLSGARPLPLVRALVVDVDDQALPPVAVVDAGSNRGLEVGDRLFVVRDGREVARLEVDEVRPRLSAARVVRAERGLRLRPGDRVTSKAPATE